MNSQKRLYSAGHKVMHAVEIIKNGGVIVCPTEGIYGLSALMHNEEAVKRVIEIKKRSPNKGLIVIATMDMLGSLIDFTKIEQDKIDFMLTTWPSHATFIVPAHPSVPKLITGNRDTIALRVSDYALLQALCSQVGEPIISTSANLSGQEPIKSIAQLHEQFASCVDYILDEPCQGKLKPSTIYDAISGKIIRA